MRAPLPAFDAFRHDAARLLGGAGAAADDPRPAHWLAVARAAERLSALPGRRRLAYARSLDAALLPNDAARPTQLHEPVRAPASPLDRLAERLRVAAEAMERAGCYELAFTTVSAVCRMTAERLPLAQLVATAQLGRIARFLGDLDAATACYRHVAEAGLRTRDGPLASHGLVGLALVANMRGNRPAERALYQRALAAAWPHGAIAVSARLGLMNVAIATDELAEALLHGWQAHDDSTSAEVRAMVVSNLASTALRGGFVEAALAGFLHTLALTDVTRIRAIAFGGAARAAARLGDRALVDRLAADAEAELRATPVEYETCRFRLSMATALTTLGDRAGAARHVTEAIALAEARGFHELAHAAERLRSAPGEAEAPSPMPAGWADSGDVATALGRLAALRA
jgi:hypothetical protein